MGNLLMKQFTMQFINKKFNSNAISNNITNINHIYSTSISIKSQTSNNIRGFSILVLAALSMTGCGQTNPSQNSQNSEILTPSTNQTAEPKKTVQDSLPTYVMAVETYYPPFSFKDESGSIIGFDIDLMNAIASHAHFNLSVLEIPWKGAFDNLQAGKFKILGSGVGITPQREEIADFSHAYMDTYVSFAYKNKDINSLKDIKNRSIGIQPEVFYVDQLNQTYGKNNQLSEYKTTFLACKAMVNAKIDLCIDDIHVLRHMEKQLPDSVQSNEIKHLKAFKDSTKNLAFAVQKGDTEMAAIINQGLADSIADGTYEKLYSKWFGNSETTNSTDNETSNNETSKTEMPKT